MYFKTSEEDLLVTSDFYDTCDFLFVVQTLPDLSL